MWCDSMVHDVNNKRDSSMSDNSASVLSAAAMMMMTGWTVSSEL